MMETGRLGGQTQGGLASGCSEMLAGVFRLSRPDRAMKVRIRQDGVGGKSDKGRFLRWERRLWAEKADSPRKEGEKARFERNK